MAIETIPTPSPITIGLGIAKIAGIDIPGISSISSIFGGGGGHETTFPDVTNRELLHAYRSANSPEGINIPFSNLSSGSFHRLGPKIALQQAELMRGKDLLRADLIAMGFPEKAAELEERGSHLNLHHANSPSQVAQWNQIMVDLLANTISSLHIVEGGGTPNFSFFVPQPGDPDFVGPLQLAPTQEKGIISELEKLKQKPDISENETGLLNKFITGIQEGEAPNTLAGLAGLIGFIPKFDESGSLSKLQLPKTNLDTGLGISGTTTRGFTPPTVQPSGLLSGQQTQASRVIIPQRKREQGLVEFPRISTGLL